VKAGLNLRVVGQGLMKEVRLDKLAARTEY
jgi:hypothetical protein